MLSFFIPKLSRSIFWGIIMKRIMMVVLFILSAFVQADVFDDIQSIVAEHASKIGVSIEAIHAHKMNNNHKQDVSVLALAYDAINHQAPLMVYSPTGATCKLMYVPTKDFDVVLDDKDMLLFFVIHEIAHCADKQYVSPKGRQSVLGSEQFADVFAMFYLQKHLGQAQYLQMMKKVMRFRSDFAKLDADHDTWSVLAANQSKKIEQDIIAHTSEAVPHTLWEKIQNSF